MQLAISHYPEYYPRDRWDRHFTLLADGGFKRVRMAESSWATFQPARDEFRWEVLDEAIEMAASHGVEVVLGTPTYVPPRWLVAEHPEILPVGRDGRRSVFGARQHRCFNVPAYLEAADAIAEAMGRRYGNHPNVVAWQIDNELGGEQKRCYCDFCQRAFHAFLRQRYGRIEDLNDRWNTKFWGQQYRAFEEIGTPLSFASDLEMRHHPALELDFQRFSSESIVRFCDRQYDILRAHTSAPITHNTDTFYWGDNVNLHHLFQKLDVAGMDLYSDRAFEIAFYSDLTRCVSKEGRFWVMEYGTRSAHLPEEFELMQSRGCEWLFLFKMLPFPWGQEIDRKALLTLGGNPEPNYHVVRKWSAREAEGLNGSCEPARTALFYDFESSWAYWVDQWRPGIAVPDRQVYPRYIVETAYRALFEVHASVDVIFEADELARYKWVVVARHLLHKPELERALISYVEAGGKLVVTSDLFRRNEDNAWIESVPVIYRALFDWHEPDFPDDSMAAESFKPIEGRLGEGLAWMLHREACLEDWHRILKPSSELRDLPSEAGKGMRKRLQRERVFDQRGVPPPIPVEV
jgi:beta-galactosidase